MRNIHIHYPWFRIPLFTSISHKDETPDAMTPSFAPSSLPDSEEIMPERGRSWFWRECGFALALIVAMALYYLIGNQDLKYPLGNLAQWNPWLAVPFLVCFIVLCWLRLPLAVTLLPLSLPFYLAPKVIAGNFRISPAELSLWICLLIAGAQFLSARLRQEHWRYSLSLAEWRERIGPLLIPVALFALAALLSILVASDRSSALRAFREEVLDPLLYVGLLLLCLRTRQDLARLLWTFFVTGLVIACIAALDYHLFGLTDAVYGSPNSTGLLFDYTLPIGLALVLSRISWKMRLLALLLCLPFFYTLLHSESRGSAWFAFPVVLLLIIVLAIRNRKVLLVGGTLVIVLVALSYGLFFGKINTLIMKDVINGHSDTNSVSTLQRRIYLWESALAMIHDQPILGYGMDNWLCHYADPRVVPSADPNYVSTSATDPQYSWMYSCPRATHYYIVSEVNGHTTHMYDEPSLSHPHNIFLHVWVSMGLLGILAFVAVLVLFFWLFVALIRWLARGNVPHAEQLRWMMVGVGAGLFAGMLQGQLDSAFLEQDLSFCFWLLVGTLLLLRSTAGMPWRGMLHLPVQTHEGELLQVHKDAH
jgi:Lipid A core - O-antigen ligase and related enzymes